MHSNLNYNGNRRVKVRGVTRLDGARAISKCGVPTFEPEIFWK